MFEPLTAAWAPIAAGLGLLCAAAGPARGGTAPGRMRARAPVFALGRRQATRVAQHLLALDAEDRARRFGIAASDDRIRLYVDQIDFERDQLFGIVDHRLRLVAVAHLAHDAGRAKAEAKAEFGISVLACGRGQGLASRLFDHAAAQARERGARELVLHIARDNAPMLAIARHAGALLEHDGSDVVARLALTLWRAAANGPLAEPWPGATRADGRNCRSQPCENRGKRPLLAEPAPSLAWLGAQGQALPS